MSEQPPDYTESPFVPEIHQSRAQSPFQGMDQNTAEALRGKLIESIFQLIVQALTGSWIPGPLGSGFSQISSWGNGIASTISGMLNGVIGGVVSTAGGLLGGFINAILGFGSNVIAAYTPENPAAANLQVQINALLADSDPSTTGIYDGFNTGPALSAPWDHVCGDGNVIEPEGYVYSSTGSFHCYRYDDDRPQSGFWQVQASVRFKPGGSAGPARIFGGADAAMVDRFPAIEYGPDIAGDVIRLVSHEGTPDSIGNASLNRIVHDFFNIGFFVIKTTDVLALECIEADGIYNVYLNPGPGSSPICTYDDSVANLIPRGVGHRDGGFQLSIAGSFAPGCGWDNFGLFDRAP